MRVEQRMFPLDDGKKVVKVLLISESEKESKIIDLIDDNFDGREAIPCSAEIRLADGYREHYILLGRTKETKLNGKAMKPSDFKEFPYSSIRNKREAEQIALNIMKILTRTGDTFRELTWEEYKIEREKDGEFNEREKSFFDNVIDYCKNESSAKLFSPNWKGKK